MNIRTSSDSAGNVWELRKVGAHFQILKNGRHKAKRATYALAERYFVLMVRS